MMRRYLVAAVLAALLFSPAAAPGQLRVELRPVREGQGLQFGWIYWWKTNSPLYLTRPTPGGGDEALRDELRDKAVKALTEALASPNEFLRTHAALTLGRLQHAEALEKLIELTGTGASPETADGEPRVRRAAWVAMGLLGSPEAVRHLLAHTPQGEGEQIARLTAFALLPQTSPPVIEELKRTIDKPASYEIQRTAMWALRVTAPREATGAWAVIARRTEHPFIHQEALLGIGAAGPLGDRELLETTLDNLPESRRQPYWNAFDSFGQRTGGTDRLHAEVRTAAALALGRMNGNDLTDRTRRILIRQATFTRHERDPIDFWRGPSLIALGHALDSRHDAHIIMTAFQGPEVQLRHRTYADGSQRRVLRGLEGVEIIERDEDDPSRGYAALAAGLGARRLRDPSQTSSLNTYNRGDLADELGRKLATYLKSNAFDDDMRAACALGLGLTGDPKHIEPLREQILAVHPGEKVVQPFAVLALAMLGDTEAANAAATLLDGFKLAPNAGLIDNALSESDRLAVQALVQTLMLVGDVEQENHLRALTDAWGRDAWLSLDAARAAGWMSAWPVGRKMLDTLDQPRTATHAVVAAASLGELLDAERSLDLEHRVVGANFTMWLDCRDLADVPEPIHLPVRDGHGYADMYLYNHLLTYGCAARRHCFCR